MLAFANLKLQLTIYEIVFFFSSEKQARMTKK